MPYITKNDDISALPLSVRSKNCLRSADIHTIGEMMNYPIEELINIRNLGKKSIEEIQSFVQALNEGTGEFELVETGDNDVISSDASQENQGTSDTVFRAGTGAVVQDILIKDLPLSIRARNSLDRNGYERASQLVGITCDELMKLRNMGRKTAEEVIAYMEKISIKHEIRTNDMETIDFGVDNDLAVEMSVSYGQEKGILLEEIRTVKKKFPEAMGETSIYRVYGSDYVRGITKGRILKLIEENGGKISKSALEESLPQHLNNTTILNEILIELESVSAIEIGEVMIYYQYPSIVQYVVQLSDDDRAKQVLQARLDGKTLQEIGDQYGITRERVRQIAKKGLKKKPYLREDKYIYIYDHYNFTLEDFSLAFDEPTETYYYLEMICQTKRSKKNH